MPATRASLSRRPILEAAFAALNRRDLDGFSAMFDSQVISIDAERGHPVGREDVVDSERWLLGAFPDSRFSVEEVIESGERMVSRLELMGTHLGPLGEHAATGRKIRLPICVVVEWSTAKVVTWQVYWDRLQLLEQLRLA